jgi:hypothetical protein
MQNFNFTYNAKAVAIIANNMKNIDWNKGYEFGVKHKRSITS